jgi:2-polyprenyl-6-methoxyphenol hydroxylase-like FAD-dependent oxidoreductase
MPPKETKVIIAGGSIAGLSLALMLEKNGVDFLVLEAYRDIAPQVGASIGVLPNGLRILDQLGCCEQVLAEAEFPVEKVFFRDSNGKPFWSFEDFNERISERFVIPHPSHRGIYDIRGF